MPDNPTLRSLDCAFTPDSENQPAVGLVVLQSDETMEFELRQSLPQHYRLFHTRIANDQGIDEQSLTAMANRLPASVSLLPRHTRFRVIAYGCTSAATVIGEQNVADLVRGVFPDTQVTNPVTAIKACLKDLAAERIALLTPYCPDVCTALISNLKSSGFRIISSGTFNQTQDHDVARISQQSLIEAMQIMIADEAPDAVVASCTNLRTLPWLAAAGALLGCPVISSNSALAWHIRHLTEIAH